MYRAALRRGGNNRLCLNYLIFVLSLIGHMFSLGLFLMSPGLLDELIVLLNHSVKPHSAVSRKHGAYWGEG